MTVEIAKSVTKNTTVMMGSQVVTWVSTFILMLFLPRYLGSEAYGRLYLAISVAMIFQMLIDFGGSYLIPKEVSRNRGTISSLIVNSIGSRAFLWVISIILMVSFSYLVGYTSEVKILILILGISKLWEGAGTVLYSCFQGVEKMEYRSLAVIAERVFLTCIGIVALLLGADSVAIGVIIALSTLLSFSLTARFMRRIVDHLPKFNWNEAWSLMKAGVPYLLISIFAVIYYRIDVIILSLLASEAVVGWYGAAFRFFDILMFLPSIFTLAVFPVLSRLLGSNDALSRTTQKSIDFILIAGIPIGVSVFVFAEEIIRFFYGLQDYAPSILVLKIFSLSLPLVYIDFVLVTTIVAMDRQRGWSIVTFIAIPLNAFLNYLLIPYTQTHFGNGGIGAAIAKAITELFVMISAVMVMPRGILRPSGTPVILKSVVAGGLMAAAVWVMNEAHIIWFVQALIGLVVYAGSLLVMKALSSQEIAFMRDYFSLQNLRNTFVPDRGANT
jgi:O-antigen/teichoic acid export membrane protein